MLIIKLTELADGTIQAETRSQILGKFPNTTRNQVVAFFERKARECDEDLRIVESFDSVNDERVNFRKMMRRSF